MQVPIVVRHVCELLYSIYFTLQTTLKQFKIVTAPQTNSKSACNPKTIALSAKRLQIRLTFE